MTKHAIALVVCRSQTPVDALSRTLRRAQRIAGVGRVVVACPPQDEATVRDAAARVMQAHADCAVEVMTHPDVAGDAYSARLRIARQWADTAWRGGLGGATVWDELLPATAWAEAMRRFEANACVLVGGGWCAFDPALASELLRRFVASAADASGGEGVRLMFSQAPPGLGAIVLGRDTVHELAEKRATLGAALGYNPRRPAIDPIGREVCLPIPATVRDTARRFVYDTPQGRALLDTLAARLGDAFDSADMVTMTDLARALEVEQPGAVFDTLPGEVVLEITPRRRATGPIVPQSHLDLGRVDMDGSLAVDLLAQLRGQRVTLGGLGDATLHPRFGAIVEAARAAGVASLHVETDLLGEREALLALVDLPIDIISVRLNADTPATYAKVMGVDRFGEVMTTLQALFDRRGRAERKAGELQSPGFEVPGAGVPWIISRLVKTVDTLPDLEHFFERWMHVVGHAVIDRFPTGGKGSQALLADQSPVPMDGPWRPPSVHQVKRRLTVLSDGRVTLCGQDFLGRAALGSAVDTPLRDLWRRAGEAPLEGCTPDDAPVCRRCFDWWSLRRVAACSHA